MSTTFRLVALILALAAGAALVAKPDGAQARTAGGGSGPNRDHVRCVLIPILNGKTVDYKIICVHT
jgi:hypothetical protein